MTDKNENSTISSECSRRTALKYTAAVALSAHMNTRTSQASHNSGISPRPWIKIRGLYGGFPKEILAKGKTPVDYGINAIWVGSGALNHQEIDRYHAMGLKIFAEFNSMHDAKYLKKHPDAAPVGPDGKPSPPPHGWQGVSPFHAGYRQNRMDEFRRVLETYDIDGIWLDYHHAHASWERSEPDMPDTDFSPNALQSFTSQTKIKLPDSTPEAAKLLLGQYRNQWTQFRCDVFTDWVKEYRRIQKEVRPKALLGTFHCPWSTDDNDGAIRHKLAIDLPAQSRFLDIFSIMPYHARFGYPNDPEWIARQTRSLGKLLDLEGQPEEQHKIWPIVQLADWGESVSVEQVTQVLDFGTQQPATGVMVFHWGGVSKQWDKVEALGETYRAMRPTVS